MTDLYRHFDKAGKLLYVGISLSTSVRLLQHRNNSQWFNEIATITIEKFEDRKSAAKAEKEAIRSEAPRYNITYRLNREAIAEELKLVLYHYQWRFTDNIDLVDINNVLINNGIKPIPPGVLNLEELKHLHTDDFVKTILVYIKNY